MDPGIHVIRATVQTAKRAIHPDRDIPGTIFSVSGRAYGICVSKRDGVDVVDYAWKRPQTSDDRRKDKLSDNVERFIRHFRARPKKPNQIIPTFTEIKSKDGVTYRAHPNFGGAP